LRKRKQNLEDVATIIRERRRSNGLSQPELAARLGMSQPTISQWELGKARPSEDQLRELEAILGGLANTKKHEGDIELPPIAVWIFRGLEKRGMTANELARKAGISAQTIYNILKGGAENPQQRTLKAIESALSETFEQNPPQEVPKGGSAAIGQLVDFNPYDAKDLPAKAGVYVFYDISGRPIYVGKSSNIDVRLRDHAEKFWFRSPIVQTAAYVEIPNEATRDQVETVLIQFLKNNAVMNKNKTVRDST
jgi:transcriptional regulator with XRE-family HTH domain